MMSYLKVHTLLLFPELKVSGFMDVILMVHHYLVGRARQPESPVLSPRHSREARCGDVNNWEDD